MSKHKVKHCSKEYCHKSNWKSLITILEKQYCILNAAEIMYINLQNMTGGGCLCNIKEATLVKDACFFNEGQVSTILH